MFPADISGVSNQSTSFQSVHKKNLLFQKCVIIKAESVLRYLILSVTVRGIHDPQLQKWHALKYTSYSRQFNP